MKSLILAAMMVPLLALPAFADCTADFTAQTSKIPALQSASLFKMGAPPAEKCAAQKDLLDGYIRLSEIYKTCQAELKIPDSDIKDQDQVITDQQKSYVEDCGG